MHVLQRTYLTKYKSQKILKSINEHGLTRSQNDKEVSFVDWSCVDWVKAVLDQSMSTVMLCALIELCVLKALLYDYISFLIDRKNYTLKQCGWILNVINKFRYDLFYIYNQ